MAGPVAAVQLPPCVINVYECPKDKIEVERLAKLADEAQVKAPTDNLPFDIDVLPWTKKCDDEIVTWHFVATDPGNPDMVCGWLAATVHPPPSRGKSYIYLREISTRRPGTDGWRKGVGPALHRELVEKAGDKYAFIYLFPLNDRVAKLYERDPWLYVPFNRDGIKHMIRLLPPNTKTPTSEPFLRPLRPVNIRRLTVELDRLLFHTPVGEEVGEAEGEGARQNLRNKIRQIQTNSALARKLTDILDEIEVFNELSLNDEDADPNGEAAQLLSTFLHNIESTAPKPAGLPDTRKKKGGRRSRKTRRRLTHKRKHKRV